MKKIAVITFIFFLFACYKLHAQVAINNDGSSTDSSAMLDVKSTSKGLLPPRMTNAQRDSIASPAAGLMIYNTENAEMEYYNGTRWSTFDGKKACGSTITDSQGNVYGTVQIGNQCWMKENLNIGTMINGNTNQTDNNVIEKYCYGNIAANCDVYGGLYQWDEMMQYVVTEGTQGICPTGWHIPSDDEWKTMEMAIGMSQVQADATGNRGTDDEGGKLKETGYAHWYYPNNGATNVTGFTGLPGGRGTGGGPFYTLTYNGYFWTSTKNGSTSWSRSLSYYFQQVGRDYINPDYGYSVRCVRD